MNASIQICEFEKPLKMDGIQLEDSTDATEKFQSENTVANFPRGVELELLSVDNEFRRIYSLGAISWPHLAKEIKIRSLVRAFR